jgi:uncharacterized protein (DUF983 family)
MSATWKGANKPGGTSLPTEHKITSEPDCPKCKFGSLYDNKDRTKMRCMDCDQIFTRTLLQKLKIIQITDL